MAKDIILIDKPKGITSFDVIRTLKKRFKETRKRSSVPKYGHAGTLDPLATGLLIVGIGEGTKKLNQYLKLPKEYKVEVLVGIRTTTGDMEGDVVDEAQVPNISKEDIQKVLQGLIGTVVLHVPAYSAIKVGGERLYKKARRGEKVTTPKKEMSIKTIKLITLTRENTYLQLVLQMEVGSGAYVRSIAEEIGRRLGYPATVKELRRTKIGDFKVSDAEQL